jgi:Zn-dependent membrane protease YugP
MSIFIYYGIAGIALLITSFAQLFIRTTYKKYSDVENTKYMKGFEAARYILDKNGLESVKVEEAAGYLTDHYDPKKKVVKLSTANYNEASISAVSVAAHECGHAIQDKVGYTFMRIRAFLVPFVNFSSFMGYVAIVIGLIFSLMNFIWIGILLEGVILLFQLVTLPVEIDASRRALKQINEGSILTNDELSGGRMVLIAAASTYVAGVLTTMLEILRLVLMFRDND